MTHTCLESPFLPLSEYTTIGGGEVTTCKSYERKTAKMAQKPGFAPRWHILIGLERYASCVMLLFLVPRGFAFVWLRGAFGEANTQSLAAPRFGHKAIDVYTFKKWGFRSLPGQHPTVRLTTVRLNHFPYPAGGDARPDHRHPPLGE